VQSHSARAISPSPQGHVDVTQLLLRSGALASIQDAQGLTPLHKACFAGQSDVAAILIGNPTTRLDAKDKSGQTPFHKACFFDRLECVNVLLEQNADMLVSLRGCGMWVCVSVCAPRCALGVVWCTLVPPHYPPPPPRPPPPPPPPPHATARERLLWPRRLRAPPAAALL
jgi:ankyrin repeat protein